mgnify:CR=1 FL=1
MAPSPQVGVHGRARRRIVVMGGIFAERFKTPGSEALVAQDNFIALLLRNGDITTDQLQQAIHSYCRNPQDYAWMLRCRHAILDKADKVFFVRRGRFPTESADFPLNGPYYEICRTLQYDPDCFDDEVKKLAWDAEGNPRIVEASPKVLEEVQQVESRKGNLWAFALILLATLATAIAAAALIAAGSTSDLYRAGLVPGLCCIALLVCALIATRPRSHWTRVVNYTCSECGGQLDPGSHDSCPNCRIRFR